MKIPQSDDEKNMRFGFGFRSTNSSSGGSSSGGGTGGGGGHLSRGRSKKIDDRPFPPQLEEHPYFNYFPMAQQNYYTRYLPRQPPAYQLPPPPPAPPMFSNEQRRRHGSFSENHLHHQRSSTQNFHIRSRSSSGRFRHMKTPMNDFFNAVHSKSNDQLDHVNNNNEPIYSEPFPPENESPNKFYPDPHDPVQISNHIYEYLVSKRAAAQAQAQSQENLISANKRRGSLSSSPSDGSSTNNSNKHQPDFSSGKPKFSKIEILVLGAGGRYLGAIETVWLQKWSHWRLLGAK